MTESNTSANTSQTMSTSRLAKALKADTKDVFRLLKEHGWIEREGDQWQLTAKGEFHGGQYQQSDKFGRYIVWPAATVDQPALASLDTSPLSASRLAAQFNTEPAVINRLLVDLGWLQRDQRGWIPTDLGKQLGGEAKNVKQGFFALWPANLIQRDELKNALDNLNGNALPTCLDGHQANNAGEQCIDNWLYLHQITHACHKPLPGSNLTSSFYLPTRQVWIDYWDPNDSSQSLSARLDKQALFQKHQLKLVELTTDALDNLDQNLAQPLLQFGVQKL
ncbi:Uncharacterised protein [BD1-7 clade bacterium]|uniref:Uncharacterized protein n=1 Tax=BD1-7 clade bacterium TaxID=2029982 RepID=A0A5S9QAP3_9GAMM|nr:Uncharacterised protein [BD1-7 clade bacterium]